MSARRVVVKTSNETAIQEEAVQERHYLWMARVFGIMCALSILANVVLLMALASLMPIVRVQPFYISAQDKDQQVIKIIRPPVAMLRSDELQGSFVRQYIVARLGIGSDVDELERRWGIDGSVQWMSSDAVYQNFAATAGKVIEQSKNDGLTRDIRILNVSPLPVVASGQMWQAEIEISEMRRDFSEPKKSRWQVNLDISMGNLRNGLVWEQRLKNPLGFQVNDFGLKQLGKI